MNRMEHIAPEYLNRAELWIFMTILSYFLMNGAQIFETAVFVPKWTAHPPHSFAVLANKDGVSLKTFWIVLHSLNELIFIATIIFCWKLDPVRNWLIILFAIHFTVRIWTLVYFAPNIIEFQRMDAATNVETGLVKRVAIWERLNYLRVALFISVSVGLVPILKKITEIRSSLVHL